jgi:hypothetical protein
MRKYFDKLIVMWKSRELMIFADNLSKVTHRAIASLRFRDLALEWWSHHLQGLPGFRTERGTPSTQITIRRFGIIFLSSLFGFPFCSIIVHNILCGVLQLISKLMNHMQKMRR